MKTSVLGPTSAGKAAGLILLLLLGWLVFLLLPSRPPAEAPAAPIRSVPQSELEAVGLRDYVDWRGLPQFFKVWADQMEWNEGRARFAYWNPGAGAYAYYFEVAKTPAGFRFREIFARDVAGLVDDENRPAVDLTEVREPLRTHPFALLHRPAAPASPPPIVPRPADPTP